MSGADDINIYLMSNRNFTPTYNYEEANSSIINFLYTASGYVIFILLFVQYLYNIKMT